MKVLIADDDPISCSILERKLTNWGYEVIACSDGTSAWEALLSEGAPQLAIVDWMMPGLDGLEICRKIRARPVESYTYILMLTAKDRKEDILTGLDAGADDYLSKPFDPHELEVRLRVGRRILDLEGGLLRSREALRIEATYDHLTGVWNRGAAMQSLEKELSRGQREGKPTGLIMADIDHFKQVNDAYGHLTGDTTLREVTRRIRRLLRNYDTIGRYGGDEFVIVLPGCDPTGAERMANRMRAQIDAEPISTMEGMIDVTISLGVANTEGSSHLDPNRLIRAADIALYRSKKGGRNRVSMATAADMNRGVTTESPTGTISKSRLADDFVGATSEDRPPMA
jgi:two-component system, cell cycle response regulator